MYIINRNYYYLSFILVISFNIALTQQQGDEDDAASPYHLKPLGSHIAPSDVDEVTYDKMITPKEFMKNYVLPRKPLVFRGVVKDWPAFQKWSDNYLKDNYPNLELRLEGKKEKRTPIPQGDISLGRDTMKHFIDTYRNEGINKYVVSELPRPLYKYVNIPSPLGCGELRSRFTEINLWINSGGAQSVLHKDSPNTINCVINGTKEWKLIEFKYNDLVYQAWEGAQEAGYGGHSLIDPNKIDLKKFPNILKIPEWFYTHIKAGDCLYLPTQMWHFVRSHGEQNLAVAFLLSQFRKRTIEDVDLADCGDDVMEKTSLDQIDVDWQYPGYGKMTMGYSDLVDYMPEIKSFFRSKDKSLSKKKIYRIIYDRHEGTAHQKEKAKNRTLGLFAAMSKMAPDGKFMLPMVDNLTRNQLREIAFYLEAHYPAGTTEYEYSFFQPENLDEICSELAEKNEGILRKSDFVKRYMDMNGSLKFAEEFWMKLAGDKEVVPFKDVENNLEEAKAKYELYRDGPLEEDDDEEENRIKVPDSDFYSAPKSMKPDFQSDSKEENLRSMKRKVNQKEKVKEEL